MDEGVLAIVFLFGTPAILAVLGLAGWTVNSMLKRQQADRARQTYERLAKDKLDVIRTALTMGRSDAEILDLDARLERLIGAEQMKTLLDPKSPHAPVPPVDLHDADLLSEIERNRQQQDQDNLRA